MKIFWNSEKVVPHSDHVLKPKALAFYWISLVIEMFG